MSDDRPDGPGEDGDLRALFRRHRDRLAMQATPSFDAILSRPRAEARPRSAAAWWLAGAAAAIAFAALLVGGVPPRVRPVADDAVALPTIRMPSDALLAAAPLPNAAGGWSSLPSAVLGRAPVDLAPPRPR